MTQIWAGDSAMRQSVTGYPCNVQGVTMCNRRLKQTAISFSSWEAVLRSQCLRRRTSGSCRTLQGTALQRFSSSRGGFRFGATLSVAQGTRRTQAYRNTMLGNKTVDTRQTSVGGASDTKDKYCRSLYETSGWTENAVVRKETWTSNPGRCEW